MRAKNENIVRPVQRHIDAREALPEVPETVIERGTALGLGTFVKRHDLRHGEIFEFEKGYLRYLKYSAFTETPSLSFERPKTGSEWIDPTASVDSRVLAIAERQRLGEFKAIVVIDPDEPRILYEFERGTVQRKGTEVREAPFRGFDPGWHPKAETAIERKRANKFANELPVHRA